MYLVNLHMSIRWWWIRSGSDHVVPLRANTIKLTKELLQFWKINRNSTSLQTWVGLKNKLTDPWSIGYGRRLAFQRSWVWIPSPDTLRFKIVAMLVLMFEETKNKRKRYRWWPMWPGLAKFGHLGNFCIWIGSILRVYLVFGTILLVLGQILYALGKCLSLKIAILWKINKFTIWSHWWRQI